MTEVAASVERKDDLDLPHWSVVREKRRAHIARVVTLLDGWARAMELPAEERLAWRDAGRWHDALRDAPAELLRELAGDHSLPTELLHGPAAAARLRADGERREGVLLAVAAHTIGSAGWDRTGRALYMADYLDPGRPFTREERAFLAAQVPREFDATFRQVLRHRMEWMIREGKTLFAPTVALWNEGR